VLLGAARARTRKANAEVWTWNGDLQHRSYIGDAVDDVLTTPSGRGVGPIISMRQWAGVAQKGTASRASTATSPSIVRGAVTIAQFFRALR
jgi:hypothetical protein